MDNISWLGEVDFVWRTDELTFLFFTLRVDTIEYLLEHGANATIKDANGQIACCHSAASHGKLDLLKLTLNQTIPNCVNSKNNQGKTPLHLAGAAGQVDTIEFLMKHHEISQLCTY